MSTRTQLQSLGSNNAHPVSDRKKEIDDLICKLVDLLSESEECIDPLEEVGLQKIMLDRNIGESRYLIIRMPVMESPRILLSPREQEIVQMVAHGHPTKVIAGILNISCWTVSAHLRRIFIKLGVTSRPAMIARIAGDGVGRKRVSNEGAPPSCGKRSDIHVVKPLPFPLEEGATALYEDPRRSIGRADACQTRVRGVGVRLDGHSRTLRARASTTIS
jgi:two-component system nitrate/nitrite response regulator NarL